MFFPWKMFNFLFTKDVFVYDDGESELSSLCAARPVFGKQDSYWQDCRTDSFPNGEPLDFERKNCYGIAPEKTTRTAAMEYCKSRNATFDNFKSSPEANETVKELELWTGLTNNDTIIWKLLNINASSSEEFCVGRNIVHGKRETFEKVSCEDLRHPICKWPRKEEEKTPAKRQLSCPKGWNLANHTISAGTKWINETSPAEEFTCKAILGRCTVPACTYDLAFPRNEIGPGFNIKRLVMQEAFFGWICRDVGAAMIGDQLGMSLMQHNYKCVLQPFANETQSSQFNFNMTQILADSFELKACDKENSEGFAKFGNETTCFFLSKEAKTWAEARSFCRKQNAQATLAYLPKKKSLNYAMHYLVETNSSDDVWIGLTSYHDLHMFGDWSSDFKWSASGEIIDENLFNYLANHPASKFDRCVSYGNDIFFNFNHCSDTKRFMCTLSDIKPRNNQDDRNKRGSWCPANTYKQGYSCFTFFNETKDTFNLTYDAASELCEEEDGRMLASFYRRDQNLALAASLCNSTFSANLKGFWLGLKGKYSWEGDKLEFKWLDQSPFTFSNWLSSNDLLQFRGYAGVQAERHKCVYFNADPSEGEIGQWGLKDCNDMDGMGALCSHPKWATKDYVDQCRDIAPPSTCQRGTNTPLGCKALSRPQRKQCMKTCGFCGKRRTQKRMRKPNGDFFDACPDVKWEGKTMNRKAAGNGGCMFFNRWTYLNFRSRRAKRNRIEDATWDDAQGICMTAKEAGEKGRRANLVHGDSCAYTTMEAYLWKEAILGRGIRQGNDETEDDDDSDDDGDENSNDDEESEDDNDSMSDENVDEDVFTDKDKLAWLGLRFNFESGSFEQISGRLGAGNHWAAGEPNLTRRGDEKYLCAAADYESANRTEWRMVPCNLTLPFFCTWDEHENFASLNQGFCERVQGADYWMHLDNTCFYGKKERISFDDAHGFCKNMTGEILKINDLEKIRFIRNEFSQSRIMNNFNWESNFFWLSSVNYSKNGLFWNGTDQKLEENTFANIPDDRPDDNYVLSWQLSHEHDKVGLFYKEKESKSMVICERPAMVMKRVPKRGHGFLVFLVIATVICVGIFLWKRQQGENYRYLPTERIIQNDTMTQRLKF
ncbi:Oidioi.mRNA.OKI2018_I69.chr2.g5601.t1.cds [Oikopleura dioica]|uniref:Oidioi.mRNA.OKI2018_I69.chr2.g5601.t1.cds n=1 Tax=Oikopleura dioica TaxID=34765 RepID=A0ABN7T568_OIKDI|nr:Oidioi.mRNA.OKI2018_I69.chr2.g5601.t1.cds [Oikopleura dioica]